jgi:medium-chain acyl-[acyl-carrier-protein] hydrolase
VSPKPQRARHLFIPRPQPAAKIRLFCFPYAGGGITVYTPWLSAIPADIELAIVEFPGRDDRMSEPPLTRLPALVETLAQGLAPYLNVRFAFYGHSMGALVAYELLRYLQRRGGEPMAAHFFVGAKRAPHLENREPPIYDLPQAAFLAEIVRRYDGFPRAILEEPELLRRFLPIVRADMELLETYRHFEGDSLGIPITAFGGVYDTRVTLDDLRAWQHVTRGGCATHMLPGGHFFQRTAHSEILNVISSSIDGQRPPISPLP